MGDRGSMGSSIYTHWLTPNSSGGDSMTNWCVDRPPMLPCDTAGLRFPPGLTYAAARSMHPGGVNVTFVDGHVEFYNDQIDGWVWSARSTLTTQTWETPQMQQ